MTNTNKLKIFLAVTLFVFSAISFSSVAFSAGTSNEDGVNVYSQSFKLVACDGPAYDGAPEGYVPCDFIGLMKQIQRIINVAVAFGAIGALLGFVYAAYLYVSGVPDNISKARGIFMKVLIGFLLMLGAWFIVYQILLWLTGESAYVNSLFG